ncbi:hypothetical protein Tco_0754252 [Tanacetum coccineum]
MSSVGKFVHDSNKAPDSPPHPHTFSSNQRHCFHCKDVLGDGEFCQRCTCMRCGSGLSKGLCLICASRYGNNPNPNSLNDSPNISENVSQSPPLIDHHCCYGCGDSLDGIFCQQCTCESCGNGAHYGYNCPPKVPIISNPEPCNNQTIDELPQTLPSFDPTCYSGDGSSFTYDSTPNFVDDSHNVFNPPSQPPTYSCEFCGNDAHYGYDCLPQVPFIYNPEPCYNQDFNFPQNFQGFQQQYICCTRCGGPHETFQCQQVIFYEPCCENCGGPHETFQCQPMNYYEPNLCYESNYSSFDQFEPPQHPVIHQPIQEKTCAELLAEERAANIDQSPPQEMSIQDIEDLKQHYLDEMKSLINDLQIKDYRNKRIDIQYRRECEIKINKLKQNFNGMSIEYRKKEKELLQQEHAAYVRTSQWFNFIYYDDDGDEESSTPLSDVISELPPCVAITPDLPKSDSLIMEDKHLDTIPETESDELIKSSVEDLVHTPSESDGIPESECDLPVCDNSSSKKNEVLDDIILIPPGNGNDHFNAESSLIESVLNRDNVISSPKIDFLLQEFAGSIHFIENLMYDNSFPRPPKTLKDDSETVIDSNNDYSSSDNDSLYSDDIDYVEASPPDSELVSLEVVEIVILEVGGIDTDILLTIKDDILCEKLLNVNLLITNIEELKDNPTPSSDFVTKSSSTSLNFFLKETNTFDNSLPESETFCFNLEEISSGSPTSYLDLSLPDYEAFFCDSEPDSGNFTMDVVEDIFDNPTREPRVHVPNVLPTHPTLQLDSDFTLSSDSLGSDLAVSFPFGTRNKIFDPGIFIEDNVFNPGILASNEEKSPHLLSHRGFKAFHLISESPMMIFGGDIPILDVLFLHFYPP